MSTISENLKEALLTELSGKNRFADVVQGQPYLQIFYDGKNWDLTYKTELHGNLYVPNVNERWVQVGLSNNARSRLDYEAQIEESEIDLYYNLGSLAQQIMDLYEEEK